MKRTMRVVLLLPVLLAGCRATHDAVVTSYHVATAPVRFVYRHTVGGEDETPPPPPTAPPTTTSDVANPGQPVAVATPTPARRWAGSSTTRSKTTSASKPPVSSSSRSASAQFPTAKPVPDRPGLVYNPFDPNGGYIDVSGYAPGSKVKDPDSQKIFIVP